MIRSLPQPAVTDGVPEPELPLLHDRTYSVRAYRQSDTELRLRGQIRDQKPPGAYIESDPEPLTVHHMVVDLVVRFPTLEIVGADVVMETHPHAHCPTITDHYDSLVGLSIARGFTHKVQSCSAAPDEQIRERFAHNLNTCHVWAEDGETITAIKRGEDLEPPLWIHERFEKLDVDIETWRDDG